MVRRLAGVPIATSRRDNSRGDKLSRSTSARPGSPAVHSCKYEDVGPNDKTGHIMLVAGSLQPHRASLPAIAGTRPMAVPVADSSTRGHGKTDTRYLSTVRGKRVFYEGAG